MSDPELNSWTEWKDHMAFGKIVFEDVSKSYSNGIEALSHVGFEIEAGQFVNIVGPSGCGKSTLLRIAAGLSYPTSGRCIVPQVKPGIVFRRSSRSSAHSRFSPRLTWKNSKTAIRVNCQEA